MTDDKRNKPLTLDGLTRRQVLRQVVSLGAGVAATQLFGGEASSKTQGVAARCFTTRDGVRLNYLEAGRGKPMVLIPGWSQTAAMFAAQITAFSQYYRVIAVDMRGHGDSEKPAYGYRVARLAEDVHELIEGLGLNRVILGGHSMGASVIWSYWDRFASDRIARLILIDQSPALTAWPSYSDTEKVEAGALFTPESLFGTADGLAGPAGVAVTEALIGSLFSPSYPADGFAAVIAENLKFPRLYAAKLLVDHSAQDWRDTIVRINVPTLVVSGGASLINPVSQAWIADHIPGAELGVVDGDDGGSHFMFLENPAAFNQLVLDFLA